MEPEKLRIGLIIDDYKVYNWIYELISHISQLNNIKISLVIVANEISQNKEEHLFFKKFIKHDQQKYSIKQNAFEIKSLLDISGILEVQSISLQIDKNELITPELEKYKLPEIDVLIKFDSTILIQPFIKFTNYGVWTYYLGEYNKLFPELYGVQEFLEKKYVTKITLTAWTNRRQKEIVLFNSYSKTDNYSLHRSLNNSFWKAVSFIPRNLQELHLLGPLNFYNKMDQLNSAPFLFYNNPYNIPKIGNLFKSIYKHFIQNVKAKIKDYFYFDQWILLYKIDNRTDISTNFFQYTRIIPPKDRFWADPFVVYRNNKYYIFIEELIYKTNKGTIVLIEMDSNGKFKDPKPVLEKNYHLSYPYIMEDAGTYYMIPETKENKTIEIYECIEFPLKWSFREAIFENIEAVDSTILKHSGKYWLFTNIKENSGTFTSDDELFLFYSNNLLNGKWTPHPQNPIVSDVRNARPAGKIINRNGRLFRPAQNCSKHYGYGIQFLEIVKLTEFEYIENKVHEVLPNWDRDLISTHTINNHGNITIIDAKIKRIKR